MNLKQETINLKDLELSSELSPERETRMVQFVECLRDITIFKPLKSKKQERVNVFNLQESLSEKCLMQSFYSRVFKHSPTKTNNFEMFKSKKDEKNLERSIELIKTISSPEKKTQVIDVIEAIEEERF